MGQKFRKRFRIELEIDSEDLFWVSQWLHVLTKNEHLEDKYVDKSSIWAKIQEVRK